MSMSKYAYSHSYVENGVLRGSMVYIDSVGGPASCLERLTSRKATAESPHRPTQFVPVPGARLGPKGTGIRRYMHREI